MIHTCSVMLGSSARSNAGSYCLAPHSGVYRAGQWIWYRSRYEVCSRRRLASHAALIWAASSCTHIHSKGGVGGHA